MVTMLRSGVEGSIWRESSVRVAQVFNRNPKGKWEVECSEDGKTFLKEFDEPQQVMSFIEKHNREKFEKLRETMPPMKR